MVLYILQKDQFCWKRPFRNFFNVVRPQMSEMNWNTGHLESWVNKS